MNVERRESKKRRISVRVPYHHHHWLRCKIGIPMPMPTYMKSLRFLLLSRRHKSLIYENGYDFESDDDVSSLEFSVDVALLFAYCYVKWMEHFGQCQMDNWCDRLAQLNLVSTLPRDDFVAGGRVCTVVHLFGMQRHLSLVRDLESAMEASNNVRFSPTGDLLAVGNRYGDVFSIQACGEWSVVYRLVLFVHAEVP